MIEPPRMASSRTARTAATPQRWRIAAVGTLVAGFAAGDAAARRAGRRSAALGLVVGGVAASAVVALGRAERRRGVGARAIAPVRPAGGPHLSVLIPARDEARVIGRIVGDLAAQDHIAADGTPLFEVLIVDDRSTDGTGTHARLAADRAGLGATLRVMERRGAGLADGKGAALAWIPLAACRGEAVVVLDADARIGPRFLATIAELVAAGAPALTARRRMIAAPGSRLARVQDDEQTLDGAIAAARTAIGGSAEFRGDGMVVRRDLLERVGGWSSIALTEDLELSSRLAARARVCVSWTASAEVLEEAAASPARLWRQRLRWAEGSIRRLFEHGPAVLLTSGLPLRARADASIYGAQLAVPPVVLGALFGGLVRRRPWALAAILGAYATFSASVTWAVLDAREPTREPGRGRARLPPVERLARSVQAALFGAIWIAAVPAAFIRLAAARGTLLFERTPHGEVGRPETESERAA